eukprot:TRINITY_DN1846_c0_g1_i6.p1 TRINITY_DN1846_c0_g1~~TRINITY_DN1846_c0_g1_i6.p1  ORF type:complete len:589 (+),score=151.24 TRINITY_DN1846_c0_g1_i6:104-1870(+)
MTDEEVSQSESYELNRNSCGDQSSDADQMVMRDRVDSGLGSPPLKSFRDVDWGRRFYRQTELQKLELIKEALHELNESHGGEIRLFYNPRSHPNLTALRLAKTALTLPEKKIEGRLPPQNWVYKPGYFLKRADITKEDIVETRLPANMNIPEGGHGVISNGLAIDMFHLMKSADDKVGSNQNTAIAKFIFKFLELKLPERLLDLALVNTMEQIQRNAQFIERCSYAECCNFLFSPFCVPSLVCEMASVMEDSEEIARSNLNALFPASTSLTLAPGVDLIHQNAMLRNLNLVSSEVVPVPVDAYHLSSTIVTNTNNTRHSSGDGSSLLSPDHVPELKATTCAPLAVGADTPVDNNITCEVAPPPSVIEIKPDGGEQSLEEQDFVPSVDIGVREDCGDVGRDKHLHHEEYLVMSLAATSDKDSVWSDVEQDSYKIYETEDDMYTVSAAVYTPETVHLDDEGGCILEQVRDPSPPVNGAVQVLHHQKAKPSRLGKRNKRKRSTTPSTEEPAGATAVPSGAAIVSDAAAAHSAVLSGAAVVSNAAAAHSAAPSGAADSIYAGGEPGGAAPSTASNQGTRRSRVRPAKLKDFV